jgi:hypothetical protein
VILYFTSTAVFDDWHYLLDYLLDFHQLDHFHFALYDLFNENGNFDNFFNYFLHWHKFLYNNFHFLVFCLDMVDDTFYFHWLLHFHNLLVNDLYLQYLCHFLLQFNHPLHNGGYLHDGFDFVLDWD